MKRLLIGVGLLSLLVSCGDSGDNAGQALVKCGTVTCKVHEVCSSSSSSPVCACAPGYTGSTCSTCASGFQMYPGGICQPIPVDCARSNACGGHGTCSVNTCICNEGYTGIACETCADGYQDNDKNAICLPTCSNATAVTCQAPLTCADTSGRAICSCPPGSSGSACTTCQAGYTKQSNGTCIQCPMNSTGEACADCVTGYIKQPDGSCAPCPMFSTGPKCEMCVNGYAKDPATGQCVKSCTTNAQCGTHGFCDMALPVPNCTCQPGYSGATCADCAPNYMRDAAGQCILVTVPGGTTLLGAGLVGGVMSLLAINPAAGTATAVRPMPSASITQLAADVDNKVLFALDSAGVKKFDIATGTLTAVATLTSANNLTMGPGGLFSIPSLPPYLLKRINTMTGAIADLGSTNLNGVQGLAYDASSGALLATRWGTASPELHRVSASDGSVTPMGTITYDSAALQPGNTKIGLAIDPLSGGVYAATAVGRTPQVLFAQHCTQMAAGLGLTGYDTAPVTSMEFPANGIGVGLTKVLGSQNGSGKEVVAYASNPTMGTTPATLRIETVNPQTFVCLMTRDENLKIVIAQQAQFAGIVFTGRAPRLAMEIEGVREVMSPLVHIALQQETYLDPSVRAYALNKVYTTSEWSTKKLIYMTSLWGTDSTAPTRLVEIDLTTNKPGRIISFNGVELQNLLTPWKP